ncbi:MAG: HAD-IIA family hydrolase [candidate division Zixibacteria bacterium]|nr:HAD-IIA family hydrolase [candidate division Zixibacteria bacterium]
MEYNHYLIDIEGTLVKDKTFTPVEGAVEWFNEFSADDTRAMLVTNNTTHTPNELLGILREKRFNINDKQISTCISAGAEYLKKQKCRQCYIIGSDAIKRYMQSKGIQVTDSPDVDAVVIGLDTNLDYEKLRIATSALVQNNARLLAMHTNKLFVDGRGRISISAGPIVKALEYASEKRAYVSGKPSPTYYRKFLKKWSCEASEVLMVSDDPLADLKGAKRIGMTTCFVTSGVYRDKSILKQLASKHQPDYAYPSVVSIA